MHDIYNPKFTSESEASQDEVVQEEAAPTPVETSDQIPVQVAVSPNQILVQ